MSPAPASPASSASTASSQGNRPGQPGTGWVLFVTLAIQALASAAAIAPAVVGPVVTRDLGWSPSLIGIYMALVYFAAMFTSVVGGTLVSRFGAMRCSQASLLISSVGMGLLCVGNLPCAAIGAVLVGMGYGPITPASSFLLLRTTPPHRMSLVFSIKQTGVPVGGVIAALVVPQIEALVGWRLALASTAIACVLCALIGQSVQRALDADRDAPAAFQWRDLIRPVQLVWRTPALRMMALCSLLFSTIQLAVTSYLVTFLNLSLGWTLIAAGVALSISQVAGVVGRILWGVVADRWVAPRTLLGILALMMAAASVGVALLQESTPFAVVAVIAAVYGASGIGWNGVFLAEVARRAPPGLIGQATGGTLLFTYLGVFVGQPFLSTIAVAAGSDGVGNYAVAYAVLVVPALTCAWLLLKARGKE
jgi:MFS family permease